MPAEAVILPTGIARDETLKAWARAHGVCWEITRHFEIVHDCKIQVGFDLALTAARPAACDGDPACAECARAHEGLERLALSLLPDGTQYDVEPFDGSFHLGEYAEPELLLTVEIFSDSRDPDGTDRSARSFVACVEAALRRLGIPQKGTRVARSAR
jgi:hypothetical protein